MRIESGVLIKANLKLRKEIEIAQKALEFYSNQENFDIVDNKVRILDNGGIAEEALVQIKG